MSNTPEVIEDDPIEVRKAKRQAMLDAGENPYGHAFDYSHHLAELEQLYAHLEDGDSTEDLREGMGDSKKAEEEADEVEVEEDDEDAAKKKTTAARKKSE